MAPPAGVIKVYFSTGNTKALARRMLKYGVIKVYFSTGNTVRRSVVLP